jgi:hypothetical protein
MEPNRILMDGQKLLNDNAIKKPPEEVVFFIVRYQLYREQSPALICAQDGLYLF